MLGDAADVALPHSEVVKTVRVGQSHARLLRPGRGQAGEAVFSFTQSLSSGMTMTLRPCRAIVRAVNAMHVTLFASASGPGHHRSP